MELETTLCYSLPVDVGQGDLLDAFWRQSVDLESFVYRVTRYGTSKWRVGERRILPFTLRHDMDRLAIVRFLTAPPSDYITATVLSELKLWLIIDKCFVYNDQLTLSENLRYPVILEDRLSVELAPPVELERQLLNTENDTSDNNLGIRFVHRLSFVVDETGVRVSLRAALNEFHEIAYSLELEKEESCNGNDTTELRSARHSAIMLTLHRIVIPYLLHLYWPQGLYLDTPTQSLPQEILDDCSNISGSRTILTGPSVMEYKNMETYIRKVATEYSSSQPIWAKIKYDGVREYGWCLSPNELCVNGKCYTTEKSGAQDATTCLFSGLYVYQVESMKDPVNAPTITEISYVWDHRVLIDINGSGALRRQIEHADCGVPSAEQSDVITSFLLEVSSTVEHPWLYISRKLCELETLNAVELFLEVSASSYISYAWPHETSTQIVEGVKKEIDSKMQQQILHTRGICLSFTVRKLYKYGDTESIDYSLLQSIVCGTYDKDAVPNQSTGGGVDWRNFTLQKRAIIPVCSTVSNYILVRMLGKVSAQLTNVQISRPYDLCELRDLSALMLDMRHARCDGILLLRRNCLPWFDSIYEKIKLRQSVELALFWDHSVLCTSDNAKFALRQSNLSTLHKLLHASQTISIWLVSDKLLEIYNLPHNNNNSDTVARIAEFEYQHSWCLRFLRWRCDKDVADCTTKALLVIENNVTSGGVNYIS